ncbi:choline dehydrogenase [Rhizobiales bacterium Sp-1]|uniref:Choline dehydrogenase n=2 Tax=Segnochrobactrum spirostomi TaxID=2608987 RepID=A0A6A7Y4R5_9HYPH|nr:choline dehydrogenase [Segnochrobactrum spirostomi]
MSAMGEAYDYIVVGAGSAGSILAARLSERPQTRVLLVEAGGSDNSFWLKIPIGYAKSYYNPQTNWMYWTEPEANVDGRKLYAPRGKVIGGSGAINAMIFVRGAREDFDDWRAAGNPGWGYDDVLPAFRRLESHAGGASPWHGGDGPIAVTPMRDGIHPVSRAFLDGCKEIGLPENPDFNGERIEGAGVYDINVRRGIRSSSSREYLRPALRRPNLTVLKDTLVERVRIEAGRAVGIEVRRGTETRFIAARGEVILSAGAFGTPTLLQLSGIGDGAHLASLGVATRHYLPAVGRNLQDHLCASFYYESRVPTLNGPFASLFGQMRYAAQWALTRSGPFAMSVNQAGGFLRGRPDAPRPNIQLYFNPLSYRIPNDPNAGLKPEPYPGFLLCFNACRPTSRGTVMAASPDPGAAPSIRPNYLSTEQDIAEVLEGARLMRRIAGSPAMRRITREEREPSRDAVTDDELLAFFRANCGSIYHPCGTAAMGPDPATSVVDAKLRVHGIDRLRVADASIFPNITSGNINAPTMMVAEMAAQVIAGGARRS